MTTPETPTDETVRVTVSMPKSLLSMLDAAAKRQRPRSNRSRHIQTLIAKDVEAGEHQHSAKSK